MIIDKFLGVLTKKGKKEKSELILEKFLQKIPLDVFLFTLNKLNSVIELKTRKRGGSYVQVPFPVLKRRRIGMAFRLFVKIAKMREDSHTLLNKLFLEFDELNINKSLSLKNKRQIYKSALNNRAFIHFRWGWKLLKTHNLSNNNGYKKKTVV